MRQSCRFIPYNPKSPSVVQKATSVELSDGEANTPDLHAVIPVTSANIYFRNESPPVRYQIASSPDSWVLCKREGTRQQ